MARCIKISVLFLGCLIIPTVFAQTVVQMANQQTYVGNSIIFYDNGGANGNVGNTYLVSHFKVSNGFAKIFFEDISIPSGSVLKVYKGLDTLELLGLYDGTYKMQDYAGKSFTVVYDPKGTTSNHFGWKGKVTPLTIQEYEKVTKPESDCTGAIPLCSNNTANTSANQYDNTGNVNDDSGGCYSGTGSGGSVWYSFTPQSSGNLDFMITPTGSTDYDFVLWDITNGCANKTEISCNFSATHGATGLASGGSGNSQGSTGTLTNQLEAVNSTHIYALCINFYGGTNDGFLLKFENDPANVTITDIVPPTVTNAYTTNCASASQFTVNFSEYIDCNTLQASDFAIPGYTVSLVSTSCSGGKTLSAVISVSPAMPPGSYNMTVSNMNDMCGNPMNSVYNINTTSAPTVNAGPDVSNCRTGSGGFFGYTYSSVTLTATGTGTSYVWSPNTPGATLSVNPSSPTTYTVTAINGSCGAQDQVVVTPEISPTPNLGADRTICQGASVNLTATGGGTYQWQETTSTGFFGGPNNWNTISGATSSSYTASPSGTTTTYYQVNVASPSGFCTGSDNIKITIDPILSGAGIDQLACAAGTAINLSGTHTNGSTFSWNQGSPSGPQVGTALTATVNPTATTNYYLTATSATGCTYTDVMQVTLADYGSIPAANVSACDLPSINMVTPPNMSGATQFTFTWYEFAGAASPCPTSTTGGTQVFQETKNVYLNQSIYAQNFDALPVVADLAASSGGWTQQVVTASVNDWGIGNTALAGMTGNHLQIYNNATINAYNATDDANKIAAYGPISGTNSINKVVSFNWRGEGEDDGGTTVFFVCVGDGGYNTEDYGYFCYSLDGITWTDYTATRLYAQATNQSLSVPLPAIFDNQNFYIGFRWVNDGSAFTGNCGTRFNQNPLMIDNINIQADVYQAPTSTYNPPLVAANTTYALQVTPVGGTCNGISSFMSNCQITCITVLPVELSAFEGENFNTTTNKLTWTTETERFNDFFLLERSVDMINWENVALVDGNGTTNELSFYQHWDNQFEAQINYYRLTQVDFDGTRKTLDQMVSIDNRADHKEIVRITNLLGQDIPMDAPGVKIILYKDGTTRKTYGN